MTNFKDLGLSSEVLKALSDLGFEKPSDIQEQAIPQLLEGENNLIGLAQTGTGKTAAFGLPLIERIDPSLNYTQGLVLAPTRELGQQIAEQLFKFSKYQDRLNVLAVYGGAAIANQIKALKKTQHIIIATPGRLIDLIGRKAVKLENLRFLVLDEADEMLNMGFKDELDEILSYTPDDKLTWLFSATMPKEIKRIVNRYMENPIEVKIDAKNQVNKNIEHQFVIVRRDDKSDSLTRFMDIQPEMRAVVFCRTRRDTQSLAEELLSRGYKADAIHGDLSQAQRDRVMKRFKSNELQMLIATDVAARGIDVNDLTHVFHFTLPDDAAYYTHRSGRTARAGKKGISIAFINGRDGVKIDRWEKKLKIEFTKIEVPRSSDIMDIRIQKWGEKILNKTSPQEIKPELREKLHTLFQDLSKEELIEKLLLNELDSLNIKPERSRDRSSGGGDGRSRGGRGHRGGGSRDRGDRRKRGGSGSGGGDRRRRDSGGERKKHRGQEDKPSRRSDDKPSDDLQNRRKPNFAKKKRKPKDGSGSSRRFK